MQLKSILTSTYTHIALIGILLLLSYGRVLGSYFLADDFGEILYISKIFNGDFGLLLSNFTGNYMQIPSMAVYRPWLLMSLAIDFAFWETNAFGYYLTNILHYFACAVLIYLIVKKLTGYWGELRSNLTALSSGLLFALNPLHCESVSWVVGRVDIVCLSFYLLGLLFVAHFNSSKKKSFLIASTVAFWFAIFTKEMAIGLPVMACALVFLCSDSTRRKDLEEPIDNKGNEELPPESSSSTRPGKDTPIATIQETSLQTKPAESSVLVKSNLVKNLTTSLNATKPVFIAFTICTITYFIIRFLALGTFTGGYTGSIGASQFSNILTKWLDPDSLFRILFPFNHTLMLGGGIYRSILSVAYFLVASLAVSRLLFGKWPKRLTALLLIWLLTALAPIYQLYGLGYNLEGMRFLFFATAPLSVVIPVILFAPWRNNFVDDNQLFSKQLVLSIVATLLMLFVFAKSSYINNTVWIEAGKQTRAVTNQIQKMANSTPEGKSFAVLGIPKENAGSHMILNGPTLSFLLEPPFTNQSMSKKLVSFEPVLYGKDDLLNVEHFRWALKNKDISNFYVWQFDKRAFAELPLNQELQTNSSSLNIQTPKLDSSPNDKAGYSAPFIMPHPTKMPYQTSIDLKTEAINFKGARTGIGMEIAPLNIQPLQYDYLEIDIAKDEFESLVGKKITLSWSGQSKLQIRDKKEHVVAIDFQSRQTWQSENIRSIRIPLSSFWAWSTFENINGINIKFPPTESLTIFKARLVPMSELAPSIQVVNQAPQGYGTYSLASADKLSLVVSPIANTDHIELEIAKNNFFFENFSGDQIKNSIWKTIKIDNQSRTAEVMRSDFQGSGYNQMRAKCVTESGDTIGEVSYPITVEIPD